MNAAIAYVCKPFIEIGKVIGSAGNHHFPVLVNVLPFGIFKAAVHKLGGAYTGKAVEEEISAGIDRVDHDLAGFINIAEFTVLVIAYADACQPVGKISVKKRTSSSLRSLSIFLGP